jgi:anti-sigma regulatory factor (Ser/Thr protein kinase)
LSFSVAIGQFARPLQGEIQCGDAIGVSKWSSGVVVGLADGLGHGTKAALAAKAFVETLEATREESLEEIFVRAHRALLHTRGAVAGVARLDVKTGRLDIGVLGNIGAAILRAAEGRSTHVLTVPGVLGSAFRTVRAQTFELGLDDAIIMHSDGVTARADFTTIRSMSPQAGAEHIVRSAGRASDDAACCVIRLRAHASVTTPTPSSVAPTSTSPRAVPIKAPSDPACAATVARTFAASIGLDVRAQWETSIVASELATNVLKFGGEGLLELRHVRSPREGLMLEVTDNGTGIADIANAVVDGFSEGAPLSPETARRKGQGLGVGLGTVHRMSDDVTIDTQPGRGTRVTAWKYRR